MISFAGQSLSAFSAEVFAVNVDDAPARSVDMITIPGRSGDLLVDGKRYPNQEVVYCLFFVGANAEANCNDAKNFLLSKAGYQRLEDTNFPTEYRIACVADEISPTITKHRDMFKFKVTFNCKPQRFLTSGETVTTLTASGSITNPTRFASQPLLRVYGAGVLGIGSQSITILSADEYTDIDCEMMDAYKGTASRNAYIQLSDYNFPTFAPGTNNISLGSGITRIEITPRWFVV